MTYAVGFGLPSSTSPIEDVKQALADLLAGPQSELAKIQIAALREHVEMYELDPESVGPFRAPQIGQHQ